MGWKKGMSKYGLVWHQVLSWRALASPHFAFIAFNLASAFLVDLRPCVVARVEAKQCSFRCFHNDNGRVSLLAEYGKTQASPFDFDTRHKRLISCSRLLMLWPHGPWV